jgi:hypothetical protein
LTVRKNRNYGITFIIAGFILLAAGVYLQKIILSLSSVLIIICGLPYLFGDYFSIDNEHKKLTLFALFGPKKWEYPYEKLEIDEGTIYLVIGGERKKLPLYKSVAHIEDWKKFVQKILNKSY